MYSVIHEPICKQDQVQLMCMCFFAFSLDEPNYPEREFTHTKNFLTAKTKTKNEITKTKKKIKVDTDPWFTTQWRAGPLVGNQILGPILLPLTQMLTWRDLMGWVVRMRSPNFRKARAPRFVPRDVRGAPLSSLCHYVFVFVYLCRLFLKKLCIIPVDQKMILA